jgi:probable phosphoglycerate mutase
LSELGRFQAAAVAAELARLNPTDAVYTSPLPRVVQTAASLCERLGLKAVVDKRLTEFKLGTNSLESIQKEPDKLLWRPDHRADDGETLAEFSARVAACCEEIVERHPEQRVAVVCHDGTIDAAIRWAVGLPPQSLWQHDFDLANDSTTEIEFWPQGKLQGGAPCHAALRRVGDVRHLSDLTTQI